MKKNILIIICTAVVVLGINIFWMRLKNCDVLPAPSFVPVDSSTVNEIAIDNEGLKVLRQNGEVLYTVAHPKDSIDPIMFLEVVSRSPRDARFALILQSAYEGESYGIVDTLTGEYRNLIHGTMDDIAWAPMERVLMMASWHNGMDARSGLYLIDLRRISTLNSPESLIRTIAEEIGYKDMNFGSVDFSPDGQEISFTYSPTGKNFKQASTSLSVITE